MQHDIQPDELGPLGPAMAGAVSTCVHCGFCLAACPTYHELEQEADSPRGRIILMKEVLEGQLPVAEVAEHIDQCLGCLACEPACPSGVPYRNLLSPFRAHSEPQRHRTVINRLQRWLVQSTLPFPSRMRWAARSGRFAKPFARLLPSPLRVMLELLPSQIPAARRWREIYPAQGQSRSRVALLLGCAQSVLEPDINDATIEVLNRNGVDVVVPARQVCCGALSWHVGNHGQARKFAARNLAVFPDDVDAIVTNAAGCGSGMHEYHLILAGTEDEQRAERFRDRVIDVSAFLVSLGELTPIPAASRPVAIAYQDACHLANAQGVRSQPRQLLRSIGNVELRELIDPHLCCGSAGTYNIDQPSIAASLGLQKAERIIATDAEIVASGNIGCLNQLRTQLASQQSSIGVQHTMQVIRDAYQQRL